jgi:hypothetical protein
MGIVGAAVGRTPDGVETAAAAPVATGVEATALEGVAPGLSAPVAAGVETEVVDGVGAEAVGAGVTVAAALDGVEMEVAALVAVLGALAGPPHAMMSSTSTTREPAKIMTRMLAPRGLASLCVRYGAARPTGKLPCRQSTGGARTMPGCLPTGPPRLCWRHWFRGPPAPPDLGRAQRSCTFSTTGSPLHLH